MVRCWMLILCWTCWVHAEHVAETLPKICLNMIVKNERDVIERCLESVKPFISYWVIVDTGSMDGTQDTIRSFLKDIPGELYERPWKNFGYNRSEAFDLARNKGDYILFMDADDVLEFSRRNVLSQLTHDLYMMWRGSDDFSYLKPQIVRGSLPWRWVGVTHEYLDCDAPYTSEILEGVKYRTISDGASSHDPRKFHKNISLLKQGLKDEPNNARYMFYLAESYKDAGKLGRAFECYQRRIAMGGWEEEVFYSMLQTAAILKQLQLPSHMLLDLYVQAHHYRPHRVEPFYYIAEIYNQIGEYQKAYDCLKAAEFIMTTHTQRDGLFNNDWISKYGVTFQLSISSYFLKHYQESLDACDRILAMDHVMDFIRNQTIVNRTYPAAQLKRLSNADEEPISRINTMPPVKRNSDISPDRTQKCEVSNTHSE